MHTANNQLSEPKLIGIGNWLPYGETMWSIVFKLSILNHLNWQEFKQLFGGRSTNSFNPITKSGTKPDQSRNFDLEKISQLTRWNDEVLLTNFSNYYAPHWLSNVPLDTKFKYCPDCIQNGVHLVFHQMLDFNKCPIHQTKLTWLKNGIDSDSFNFEITRMVFDEWKNPDDIRNSFKSGSHSNVHEVVQILKEYKQWLSDIDKRLLYDRGKVVQEPFINDGKQLWCNRRYEYLDLIIMNDIIPAPNWLQKCLFNDRKLVKTTHRFGQGEVSFRCNYFRDPNHIVNLPGYDGSYGGMIGNFVRKNTVEEASKLFTLCFKNLSQLSEIYSNKKHNTGVFYSSFDYWQLEFGRRNSAWNTALCILQSMFSQSMERLFNGSQIDPHGYIYESVIKHPIWKMWIMGPGKVFSIYANQTEAIYFQNKKFLNWLRPIWVKATICEIYYWIVGIVCFTCSTRLDGLITSNFSIEDIAIINSKYPVWLIEKEGHRNVLVQKYSMIASHEEFVSLKRSGFKGIDENLFTDFEKLQPLISLLSLDDKCVSDWKVMWQHNAEDYLKNR